MVAKRSGEFSAAHAVNPFHLRADFAHGVISSVCRNFIPEVDDPVNPELVAALLKLFVLVAQEVGVRRIEAQHRLGFSKIVEILGRQNRKLFFKILKCRDLIFLDMDLKLGVLDALFELRQLLLDYPEELVDLLVPAAPSEKLEI